MLSLTQSSITGMILTQDVDLMMSDGVSAEHTDERSIVSDTDVHDDETVVSSQQHVHAVSDQCSRCRPAVLDQVPRHPATVVCGRRQAAGRQVGTVEM